MGQLPEADARGDVGHVELAAGHLDLHAVLAGADHALQPPLLAACGERRIGQHQRAALGGGEVLVGVEAEGHEIAEAADGAAPPARTERLRRVLDHAHAMLASDGIKAIAVDGRSEEHTSELQSPYVISYA